MAPPLLPFGGQSPDLTDQHSPAKHAFSPLYRSRTGASKSRITRALSLSFRASLSSLASIADDWFGWAKIRKLGLKNRVAYLERAYAAALREDAEMRAVLASGGRAAGGSPPG